MDELGDDPAMAFMRPFDVPLDNAGAIVVDGLEERVWDVNEGDVVQVPLRVVEVVC